MFPFPGLMLYHRIPRAKALDNANRQRVYDAIREEPAIRVGTLAARLGLNRDTVLEHIRVLERFRLVESAGAGQRRYFASGMIGSIVEKNAIAATSASSTKRVLSLVQARGEVEFRDLVRSLGLSSPLTSWSVKRLERAGLVRKERRDGRLVVSLAIASLSARGGEANCSLVTAHSVSTARNREAEGVSRLGVSKNPGESISALPGSSLQMTCPRGVPEACAAREDA